MMKALTIKQPWAWAILRAGKNVENRTWGTVYRGPLLIHSSLKIDEDALADPRIRAAWLRVTGLPAPSRIIPGPGPTRLGHEVSLHGDPELGVAAGLATLVDVHPCGETCADVYCGPWGEVDYGTWHWILEDPQQLPAPIPVKGRLGLWTVDPALAARVLADVALPRASHPSVPAGQ